MADGYPANQIVLQLHDWLMSADNQVSPSRACCLPVCEDAWGRLCADAGGVWQTMSAKCKALICRQLAATDKCLVDGADETLQLLHLSSVTLTAMQAA